MIKNRSMSQWALVLSLAFSLLTPTQSRAEDTIVEVVGLTIQKPVSESLQDSIITNSTGTLLSILLSRKDKFIVGMKFGDMSTLSFSDDKGTNIVAEEPKDASTCFPGLSAEVSPDGHACLLTASGATPPAKGATTVALKTKATLMCGSIPKTTSPIKIALKKGATLIAGVVKLQIFEIEREKNSLEVTFDSAQPLDIVRNVVFLDGNGRKITSKVTMSAKGDTRNQTYYQRTYRLVGRWTSVAARITYFSKVENLPVAINVTTGVGL